MPRVCRIAAADAANAACSAHLGEVAAALFPDHPAVTTTPVAWRGQWEGGWDAQPACDHCAAPIRVTSCSGTRPAAAAASSSQGKCVPAAVTCGLCHTARYCSADCMAEDGQQHRRSCRLLAEVRSGRRPL